MDSKSLSLPLLNVVVIADFGLLIFSDFVYTHTHTHACTHARTHTRMHSCMLVRTHITHTHHTHHKHTAHTLHTHHTHTTHTHTNGKEGIDKDCIPSLSHYASSIQCGVYIMRTKNRNCNVTEVAGMAQKDTTLFNSQASGIDVRSQCSGRSHCCF